MNSVKNYYSRDLQALHDKCQRNMFFHIILKLKDGSVIDGIIEKVEPERIIILVGEDVMEENENREDRQIFGGGRPRRRFRRFRRRGIPIGALAALSLLQYPYPPYHNYYYPQYGNYDYDYDDDHDHDDYDDDDDYDHDDKHHHYYGPYDSYY